MCNGWRAGTIRAHRMSAGWSADGAQIFCTVLVCLGNIGLPNALRAGACQALAALGFSFKAIFVKLAYAVPQPMAVDAVTLLALRMAFSLPFFA